VIILTREQFDAEVKRCVDLYLSKLKYDVVVLEHKSNRHDGEIKALAENAGVTFRNGYRTEPKVKP
jgi:hypothetical protein